MSVSLFSFDYPSSIRAGGAQISYLSRRCRKGRVNWLPQRRELSPEATEGVCSIQQVPPDERLIHPLKNSFRHLMTPMSCLIPAGKQDILSVMAYAAAVKVGNKAFTDGFRVLCPALKSQHVHQEVGILIFRIRQTAFQLRITGKISTGGKLPHQADEYPAAPMGGNTACRTVKQENVTCNTTRELKHYKQTS